MTEHRLFLLAYPPVGVAAEISRFRDASGLVRRPVADDRLHTTIGMAGTFDKSPRVLIARIRDRLTGCSLPSCRIVLDTIIGGPKSALLKPSERLPGFEALQAGLARRLAATLADLGMDVALWARRIKPHVTIGYDGPPAPAQPIEPVSWTIDRVFLVESLHGRGKHIVHATHPLTTD